MLVNLSDDLIKLFKEISRDGLISDIIREKRLEEALKFSGTLYQDLVETAQDIIWQCDFEGRFIYLNQSSEEIFGYRIEEMLGKKFTDFQTPEHAELTGKEFTHLMTEKIIKGFETAFILKSGKEIYMELNAKTFNDKEGNIAGARGTAIDITERKQMEEGLRKSEEQFKAISEYTFDWESWVSPDGKLLWVNPAVENITGYTREEYQNLPERLRHVIVEEDHERVFSLFKEGLEQKQTENDFQFRIKHKDGLIKWVSISFQPIYNSAGVFLGLRSSIRDISSRKQAEEALRVSEDRFRQVTDSAGEWIWKVDSKGLYLYCSPSVEKILGYSPGELVGQKHFYDFFAPEIYDSLKEAALSAFGRKEAFRNFVNSNIHKNGNIVILETSGVPVLDMEGNLLGYRGSDTDVTERIQVEEKLRKSESQFRSVWENSFDGMRLTDKNGNIVLVNGAFCKMADKTRDELEGKPLSIIYAADRHSDILNKHIYLFSKKTIEPHLERELILWNGKKKWFELSNSFIEKGQDGILSLSIFRDISERKKSESDQLRLRNLESLGVLAGGIAHDFNNLLTSIMGYSSVIEMEIEDEEIKKNISKIINSAKKATILTQQLLTFAEGGLPQRSIISIRKTIDDAVNDSFSGSKIEAEINFNDTLQVEVDPVQLSQAIKIIAINAKESMPGGGKVTVSTSDVKDEKKLYVKIIIKDTGTGIPKENITKIFDPYFSTKPRGSEKGGGLGLSICHSIIKKHGGKILVESEVGSGTIFEILLPAVKEENKIK